MSLMNFHILTQ